MEKKKIKKYKENTSKLVINEDPEDYGSKGELWAIEFVKYMKSIVTHPVYSGMPDAIKEDGKIQWEAPSTRSGGKYQYTHQKRREWWQKKAQEIGIDINSDKWISKTAKLIHPTGEKPCKRCGQTLRIAYTYPQKNLIKRINKEFGEDFEISPLETISEIIQKAIDLFGIKCISSFRKILKTSQISIPDFKTDLDSFLLWTEDEYIPSEPSVLSPGVMSNPPDRFDGFHSFNLCCRGKADKGRSLDNLKTYTTDRRVFEFWSDGDWVAADRLMGLVRTVLKEEACADGSEGTPTADHIGPLSLGFCHRPQFRLLSKEANSAKNNRMTLEDVSDLLQTEKVGIQVASWYAQPLWDLRKDDIIDEEKALRLSKMLRDNQRNAMVLLSNLLDIKAFTFLTYLLDLSNANFKIEFENLRVVNFITQYDKIIKENRDTKYSTEQKSRRLRIGFDALRGYREKENRHLQVLAEDSLKQSISDISKLLDKENIYRKLDKKIEDTIFPSIGSIPEMKLRALIQEIPEDNVELFEKAKIILSNHMSVVAKLISQKWDDDRYVRDNFELD
jgi:Alw26I/Eco31I/Esp3I family type II restriction endonuclease